MEILLLDYHGYHGMLTLCNQESCWLASDIPLFFIHTVCRRHEFALCNDSCLPFAPFVISVTSLSTCSR